ncbi:hypothetical protein GGR52DRAFT_571838 [Hypoxylon sp. FL1284]|nr:hypothetical protein GGR52DRAFT_571838 [Hypoxylon sp. FL1284]
MAEQDEDYTRQVEESNKLLLDGLEAHKEVAERGEDIEEFSWDAFLTQLEGLVADGDISDSARTEVKEFRDKLLNNDSVLFKLRGGELRDKLNTPKRGD